MVDPRRVTQLAAPPVVLQAVLLDEHPVVEPTTKQPKVVVPPGRHRLEFEYAGLSFAAPERVRYKYRMADLETEWVKRGNKRSAVYSHVPAGSYRFQVIACNSDGLWNETGASIAVTVWPFFWQTWWFRFLSASALVSATGGVCMVAGPPPSASPGLEISERQRAVNWSAPASRAIFTTTLALISPALPC